MDGTDCSSCTSSPEHDDRGDRVDDLDRLDRRTRRPAGLTTDGKLGPAAHDIREHRGRPPAFGA